MPVYAEDTKVPVARSREHIQHELARFGAERFAFAQEPDRATVMFELGGRRVVMVLPMPDRGDVAFTHMTGPRRGERRSATAAAELYERAKRARWRALFMVIKAKLVAVEAGITTIEREFLADVVLPNGQTVGQWVAPQLEQAYNGGRMPALLPGATQ